MQKLIGPFFAAVMFFAADFSAKAQCDDGEVLVEFIVDTDAWAYEMYWELVPGGVECGVGESLMSGGNVDVGCSIEGGGVPGYTYGNNEVQATDAICVAEGSQLTLYHVDSYGDGGTDFYVLINGVEVDFLDGTGNGNVWNIDVNTDGLVDYDSPCDALEVAVDGTTYLMSSVDATTSFYEVAPPALGCNHPGGWCEGNISATVWAKFTVEESVAYEVKLCNENTSFDTQLALWVNDGCNDFESYELLGANDDAYCSVGAYYGSTAYTPCLEVGTEVYVQIDGYNGQTGISEISVMPTENEPVINSSFSNISCALETEFNPDGWISLLLFNEGLGAEANWTGPFGYTSTGTSISGLLPGVYSVELTSSCPGTNYAADFEIINPEELEVSYTVNSICEDGEGGSVDITITGGTGEYDIDWSGPNDYEFEGEDLPQVSSGDYSVEIVDAEGCSIAEDINVPFVGLTPYSLGDDLELCAGDMHIFLAPTGNYTYEWQDGSGASMFILQTEPGFPTTEVIGLSVTNDYGCELSDAVVVTVHNCASIDEELMSAWGVFPNPVTYSATLKLDGVAANSTCQIRDSRGRVIESMQASENLVWDASNLEAGVYQVEVLNENGVVVWHSKAIIQ